MNIMNIITGDTIGFVRQCMNQSGQEYAEFQSVEHNVLIRFKYDGNGFPNDNETVTFRTFVSAVISNVFFPSDKD